MSMSVIGMDKRVGRAFVTIAVSLIGALTTTAGAQRRLQMEVQVTPPDPSRMIIGAPTTKTYVGLLRNAGKSSVLVQFIPISERTQGSGGFGACYWIGGTRPRTGGFTYLQPSWVLNLSRSAALRSMEETQLMYAVALRLKSSGSQDHATDLLCRCN